MTYQTWADGMVLYAGSLNENFLMSRNFYKEDTIGNVSGASTNGNFINTGSFLVILPGSFVLDGVGFNGSIWSRYNNTGERIVLSGTSLNAGSGYPIYTNDGIPSGTSLLKVSGGIRFSGGTIAQLGSYAVLFQTEVNDAAGAGWSGAYVNITGYGVYS